MVKTLIRDCHRLAKFFHSSSVGLRTLNMKQNELGLKETTPPMDVITRWNSTHKLLGWILINKSAINLALAQCLEESRVKATTPSPLSRYLQEILQVLVPLLSPVAGATDIFSTDKNVSTSLVYPTIKQLLKAMQTLNSFGVGTFKEKLVSELQNRFTFLDSPKQKDDPVLLLSTILDPRFKSSLFSERELICRSNF